MGIVERRDSQAISWTLGRKDGPSAPRPPGTHVRELVESTRAVDVLRWRRDGVLPGPGMFSCTWSGDRETVVNVYHEPGSVVLSYDYPTGEGAVEPVRERVEVVWVPCRFGGCRPFFICPAVVDGRACRRRVPRLYQGGRYFACRRCYGLVYTSQRQSATERALARAQRIRMRLGGSASIMEPFPPRRKWMRRAKYDRLFDAALDAELRWERGVRQLCARTERFLARVDAAALKRGSRFPLRARRVQ